MNENKKPAKNPHAGHRARMRKRFESGGFDGYSDHEMLEQLLFDAIPRENTNVTAHLLLERFGSVEGVLTAPAAELMTVRGVGEKSAKLIAGVYPSVLERIVNQYKEAGDITVYDIALLLDYTFTVMKDERVHALLFSDDGVFVDFIPLTIDAQLEAARMLAEHGASVIILASREREKLVDVMMPALTDALVPHGIRIENAFYRTSFGFESIYDSGMRLELYKEKPNKRARLGSKSITGPIK